ncbi:MAG: N-acetylmuramoyl-L-alanine amidase, partial [Stackebrandtia sp.]
MSRRSALWRRLRLTALGGVAAATVFATVQPAGAAPAGPDPSPSVNRAFAQASQEFHVPGDLLVAVGYSETHLDGHDGRPSHANGYGVMHLVSNPTRHTLERAAELTGEPAGALKRDTPANVRGGAAVLRTYADALGLDRAERRDLNAWYPVVARYSGARDDRTARLYADTVYRLLDDGVRARTDTGVVSVAPREVSPDRGRFADVPSLDASGKGDADAGEAGIQSADYPPAHWVPAYSGNYSSGRSSSITAVVIHVTQGSYAGTISWFQSPSANVS